MLRHILFGLKEVQDISGFVLKWTGLLTNYNDNYAVVAMFC